MANWARGRVTAGLMAAGLLAANLAMTGTAMAQDVLGDLPIIGKPQPGAIGFQPASSSLAHDQQWLDRFVLWIITGIVIFVTALSDSHAESEGFAAGAVDYITKPVSAPVVRARAMTWAPASA